jgi:hypothetical protein
MRKSYIANSAEALNLHNGSQTAIVVAMKVQPKVAMWNTVKTHSKTDWCDEHGKPLFPPYALGQEVYVRDAWCMPDDEYFYKANGMQKHEHYLWDGKWNSAVTMPKNAARTRFKIVSCDAVRVKDLKGSPKAFEDFCKQFGIKKIPLSKPYGVNKATHAYSLVDMQGSDEFLYDNCLRDYYGAFGYYIAKKLGNNTWDNNHFIWYYKIEKL